MTFSDKLGAQVAGQEGVLLPQDRPSDAREVAAMEAAGAGTDNEFASDFAEAGQIGDEIEESLDALAASLKGLRDKLNQRVAVARAEAEQAKAAQAAAEEETKAAQAQAEAAAAEPNLIDAVAAAEPEEEEAKAKSRAKT